MEWSGVVERLEEAGRCARALRAELGRRRHGSFVRREAQRRLLGEGDGRGAREQMGATLGEQLAEGAEVGFGDGVRRCCGGADRIDVGAVSGAGPGGAIRRNLVLMVERRTLAEQQGCSQKEQGHLLANSGQGLSVPLRILWEDRIGCNSSGPGHRACVWAP